MAKYARTFDFILSAAFIAVIALAFFFAFMNRAASRNLIVQTPDGKFSFPLEKDALLEFEGCIGKTSVRIQDGFCAVNDSPCENKNCVQAGKLSRPGDWAACLPNGILLFIEGGKEETFDALAN